MWCLWVVLALFLAGTSVSAAYSNNYIICVLPQTPSYFSAEQICAKLEATPVRCVIGVDRLDCMKQMSIGKADFAVFEAEDLVIATDNEHLSDILITHRIHATEEKKWEFAVVALVSNKASISQLSDLKGKKLCHPGNNPFAAVYDWSEVFSLYFENRVVPELCDKDVSVEENRIKALATFFGESCKPGVWAADPETDIALKMKYKSMCDLCDVPSVCSQRDKYWGRQGALYCLSDCLGDVAWSMLKDAKLHFSNVGVSVCSDVRLLCPNGSTMPLNSTHPCVWVTRPVPAIAVRRSKAAEIQKMLDEVLEMPGTPNDFVRLLESNLLIPPLKLKPSVTPADYLATAPGFLSANSMSVCGQGPRAVTMCVGALQDKIKCEWLSAVARVYGVEPALSCLYGANCQISVANGSADVTIVNTDDLLPAIRDHNLKTLLVQMPTQLKKAKTVSAVVKAGSKIKKLSDLKGKRACFPSVDGIGWSSFIMRMQKTDSFPRVCPYTEAMSKFFSLICVSKPSPSLSGYPNIKMCTTDYTNEMSNHREELLEAAFDNEALAFECLAIGGGDVAFVSTELIYKYLERLKDNPEAEGLTEDSFRAVCDDTSDAHDCSLSWASYSQVLVHNGISASREEDVRSLFTGFNNLFVHRNTPSIRTFNMFAPVNSLFDTEDTVRVQQRLEQIEDFLKKAKSRPHNYEIAINSLEKCSTSSVSRTSESFYLLLILGFTVLILKK